MNAREKYRAINEFWERAKAAVPSCLVASSSNDFLGLGEPEQAQVPARPSSSSFPEWNLDQLPIISDFGDSPELADQLLELLLNGTKTATAATVAEYEEEEEPLPRVGDLTINLDGQGRPRALTRTTSATVKPFREVDAEHAYLEGEDDRTLASWRREHEKYWRRVLPDIDVEFSESIPILLDRFELLYQE